MKVYKLTDGSSMYIVDELDGITYELEYMALGDKFTLTCEDMDEEEFSNLSEFEGF